MGRLEELRAKRERLLRELGELEGNLREFERENKIYFFTKGVGGKAFRANPVQGEVLDAWRDLRYKEFVMYGGNQMGKTFLGVILSFSVMFGWWPWEWWQFRDNAEELGRRRIWPFRLPVRVRVIGQDWEKHIKTVLVPALKELWPRSRGKLSDVIRKNNIGVEALWTDPVTGSTLEILSNRQDTELFEGWSGDMIWFDEPPKRDIYIACSRGLIKSNGRVFIGATLLKEAWIDTEVVKRVDESGEPDLSVFSVHGESYANVGYGVTEEGIASFKKKLTEEEVRARIHGIPTYKSGLVVPIRREVHLVKRFEIPSDWLVDVGIDVHPKKPQHVLFMATNPNNLKYLCFEIVGHGDGGWIADQIIKVVSRYCLRVNRVVIDPLAKGDSNNPFSLYDKIADKLAAYGMMLEIASKDKEQGILEINSLLWTPNDIPALYIFRDLRVAVRQIEGWMYDDDGKPGKEDDDQCENLYRLCLLNTQYFEPMGGESEEYYDVGERKGSPVTGY